MNQQKIKTIFDHFLLLKRLRIFAFIFVFLSNNVFATTLTHQKKIINNSKPQVFVRDYKYFRKYYYKDAEFVVNKTNSKIKNIIFTKGEKVLSVTLNNEKAVYQLMVPGKTKRHFMLTKYEKNKKTKIGYYTVNRKTYFDSAMPLADFKKSADGQTCSRRPNWSFGELAKITKVLGDEKNDLFSTISTADFIDESCKLSEDGKDELTTALDLLFKNNAKKIFSCLQTEQAQKILSNEKNINLLSNANLYIARMTSLLDRAQFKATNKSLDNLLSQNENQKSDEIENMKIKCAPNAELKNKSGCFVDQSKNPAIILDLTKIKQTADINKTKFGDEIDNVLIHEFYHFSNQQIETPTQPGSLDEKIIQSLQTICPGFNKSEKAKIENTANLAETEDKFIAPAVESAILANNSDTPSKLTALDADGIVKINDNAYVLSESPVSLAKNTVIDQTEGAKIEIFDNIKVLDSVTNLFNSFTQSTSGLGEVLSGALKVSEQPAVAKSMQTNVNPQITNSSTTNSKIDVMSSAEIFAAQSGSEFNIKSVSTIEQNAKTVTNSFNQNSQLPKQSPLERFENAVSNSNVNTGLDNKKEIQVSSPIVKSQASTVVSAKNTIQRNAAVVRRDIASEGIQNSGASQKTSSVSEDVEVLSRSPQINGTPYTEIIKKYQDPKFQKDLEFRGIAIRLNNDNNKMIGSPKPLILFIDNGNFLKKVK